MDILLLTTPAQHTDTNPSVIQQAKRLQAWCETLPTMNVIETVNMLKQAINPFNELQINSADRLKLLEIYRKAFEEILYSYDELRLRSLPIAPEQRKAVAEDIMWLYLDLANGYKIIIKEAHATKASPKRNSGLLNSLYRAMELLLTAIVYARKAHATPPPLVLLEIKQLFLFAEFHELLEARVKTVKDRLSPASIGNLFKQFILFTTLKDDVFTSEDILEFFTLLDHFTTQVVFLEPDKISDYKSLYSIDLIDDELPQPIINTNDISLSETLRIIDISSCLATMQAILDQHKNSQQSFMVNKEDQLLRTFLSSFNTASTVSGQPSSIKGVKLANGIETIHYLLENVDKINELFNTEINSGIEVQSTTFDEETLENLSDWTLTEETDAIRVLATEESNANDKLNINSIVALIQPMGEDQPPVIITGILRKIRKTDDALIKIGIEVLPGHPLPFSYLHRNGEEQSESGLYFPPITALKRPASLLIDKNNFKNDVNWSILINHQELVVQPTTTILETNDFTQFNFNTLN